MNSFVLNPLRYKSRRRLKTGGAGELWVLGIAIALLTLGIYLANGVDITTKVSQNLGLRDGIVRIYNKNASTNNVYAEIKGYINSKDWGKGAVFVSSWI